MLCRLCARALAYANFRFVDKRKYVARRRIILQSLLCSLLQHFAILVCVIVGGEGGSAFLCIVELHIPIVCWNNRKFRTDMVFPLLHLFFFFFLCVLAFFFPKCEIIMTFAAVAREDGYVASVAQSYKYCTGYCRTKILE